VHREGVVKRNYFLGGGLEKRKMQEINGRTIFTQVTRKFD
jgi:hypothetical protein